uniref:Uncharacterized protein n=1 Tax=Romanomermis culicivorax TaxID=13658 RepID=A0A915IP70_ROMCU
MKINLQMDWVIFQQIFAKLLPNVIVIDKNSTILPIKSAIINPQSEHFPVTVNIYTSQTMKQADTEEEAHKESGAEMEEIRQFGQGFSISTRSHQFEELLSV